VEAIRWRGRTVTAEDLCEAAREARREGWLDEAGRLFLHGMGLGLAAGARPAAQDRARLETLLDALHRSGSFTLATVRAGLREPAGARGDGDALALDAELARLELLLAAACEGLQACRERLGARRPGGL
jgi:hypothetical protein